MNRPQLIQEIISGGFEQYDQAGLIDYQSLNRWIRIELQRFGSNIMVGNETTLTVTNGKTKLPENFWKLDLALKVYLTKLQGEGDEQDFLQSRLYYKERTEVEYEWTNNLDDDIGFHKMVDFKCTTEDVYFPNYQIRKYYGNGQYLRLTKGFNKDKVSKDCNNLSRKFTNSCEHQINIMGDYINTNFEEGYIYIQYSGLETDQEGELVIPECNHDRISEYLINYCRLRILKDIYYGDDDVNMVNKLNLLSQDTRDSLILAQRDAEWHGAQGWKNAMKKKKAERMSKFEYMLPQK